MMDGKLLVNTHICSADKIILSYFKNLNNKGKGYWGSIEYLAKVLGMQTKNVETRLHVLEKYGILRRMENVLVLNYDWNFIAEWDGQDTHKSNIMEALEKFSNKMRVNNG